MAGSGFDSKEMTDSDILRWAHQFFDAILPVIESEATGTKEAGAAKDG